MRCIRRSQIAGSLVARGTLWPRRIPMLVLCLSLLLTITACSFKTKESAVQHAPPPPSATDKNKAPANIAAMPSAMDTFRALAPPEGLRFTPLFDEPIEDTNTRIKRLETTVQTIRNDLDTVVPTMVRMVAIEKDIKGLVAQLQTLTDQGAPPPAAPVAAVTPQELPPTLPVDVKKIPGEDVEEGTKPAQAGSDPASSLVTPEAAPKGELPPEGAASPYSSKSGDAHTPRIADYPDKTRIVIDMTADAASTATLADNGKTLVIPLSKLNWLGSKSWDAESAELISGWHVEEGNLRVTLMYAAQIKYQSILKPGNGNRNHRFVVDLFSAEVHK